MPGDEELAALIVDDDEIFRTRLGRALEARGWKIFFAANGGEAVSLAREGKPHLAVVDLRLGDESGLDVIRSLRPLDHSMFIIVLTGWGSIATALEAVRGGANHYMSKPVDADQLVAAYRSLLSRAPAAAEPAEVPSLARVEWEHIQRVLTDCGGNISLAAKQLRLHRRSLQRKLGKYPPRS
ncbi:MAG TPA: response regulator [Acidobacteriaceae bacterium]|nr:response regulator [Acidobacteriaceae bacterium]